MAAVNNSIALISKYLPLLDRKYQMESKTAILDLPSSMIQETMDAKSVLIPSMVLNGLADYGRNGAVFPCIVMQTPLSRPLYMGAAWDISVTLEIWADELYDPKGSKKGAADYFTELKSIMLNLNFQCVSQIPAFRDIILDKIRYGGYFESRRNSITNNFERKN